MREPKFRAWDKERKIIYDVSMLQWEDGKLEAYCVSHNPIKVHIGWAEVGSELELIEFTGLKDKNGKEIYEGDVVKYTYPQGLASLKKVRLLEVLWDENSEEYSAGWNIGKNFRCEIIGNIYENSNLLKEIEK